MCLWRNRIPCASSSRLLTSTMSASATSNCRFNSANSSVRPATGHFATCISRRQNYTWDYDPLRAVVFDSTQSLRGYYLHRAHLKVCGTVKRYIISRTSKPVSKLLTTSCNPLSADEILSITVPINVRCYSEIDAFPSKSLGTSDRAPDDAGLIRSPFSKAGY